MTNLKDINNTFRRFYIDIYKSECSATDEDITSFLNDLNFPRLNEEQREYFDRLITENYIM